MMTKATSEPVAASVTTLYTPEVLALAMGLAAFPLTDDLPLVGEARSASCGSVLRVGVRLDAAGAIAEVGLAAQACAIGQAAAAIFAQSAVGRDRASVAATLEALTQWLGGGDSPLDWPGLEAIAAARAFPGRHGAILLPWRAALAAIDQIA